MALADLMKKGFLTAATLKPATVATLEAKRGGNAGTVATVATVAVATIQNLKTAPGAAPMALPDLVRGFMDEDGLTLSEAQALAAVSVQLRPVSEWLAMIAELDALIGIYCAAEVGMTDQTRAAIRGARLTQSLASIPASLEWFQREVARMNGTATQGPQLMADMKEGTK